MRMYSIYDVVAMRFNNPFVCESDEVANRSFQHSLKDNPFASDFDLYCVGTFIPDVALDRQPVLSDDLPVLVSHFIGQVIDNG